MTREEIDLSNCSVPCNICGSSEIEELSLIGRNSKYLRTVICRDCGLAWSDPRPDSEAIRNYYAKDYRIAYKGRYTPKLKHVFRAGKIAESRYAALNGLLSPGDAVLDIGAGGGEFVYLMRKQGFDAAGIEPNEGYGNYAKEELGLPITVGFIQAADLPDDFYHCVTLHHVLEHLDDPLAVLKKVNHAMRMNGVLAIEVPNIEGTCFAPSQRFHEAHLFSFNAVTLRLIGEAAGFVVVDESTSDDGGVIGAIFRKTGKTNGKIEYDGGNFSRIASIVRSHSVSSYYLSRWPYSRRLDRLRRFLRESVATNQKRTGRDALDSVFGYH